MDNKNNPASYAKPSGLQVYSYSSPLPPPEALAHYERVQSGLIGKIIQLTEDQANHRRAMERAQLDEQIAHQARRDWEARLGQIFAFIIAIVAILVGAYIALQGYQWAGTFISAIGLSGIITPFIIGRQEKNKS